MKTKIKIWALVLVLLLTAAGAALANDAVEAPRWVLGGGATDATTGGGVALRATLGQPVVGLVASSGDEVTLGQGFWHGGSLAAGGYSIYLPLVVR